MSCMECLYAHIPSHSQTPSHMPMPSMTTVTGSTNDAHIPSPYRLTSTQCKCQWATNPKSIPSRITHVLVINITMCRLWAMNFLDHTASLLHLMFQAFHLRGLTTPFLLRPTHINYISLYTLNCESFIRRRPSTSSLPIHQH